ncbi:Helix-turn-helix domain-containing protein [Spirosomataceae bacterium TFI 002]|nr:Helix-turn-helix domain-containing protein [Spirosomataceae bacterium TFI 002]
MRLQIKNMVCPRCLSSVRAVLDDSGIKYKNIELGSVELIGTLSESERNELERKLELQGFELLSSEESQVVNAIKSFIISKVHYNEKDFQVNLSTELSNLLRKEYSILSKTFSHTEGITIEQFLLHQRVEKVKELLSYEQKNISEIAIDLGYSSTAHLSSQFKKITGMTPTAFKKLAVKPRISIDKI